MTLTACDQQPSSNNASGTATNESTDILVGEYGSTSGPTATFGQTTHNGLLIAVKERNDAGGIKGRKIKLISYDNQGKSDETKNAVQRLINSDKVVAVIGEVASGQSLVAAPIAQNAGIPMISPSSTNPAVTQVGNMIFRVCFIDPDQGYGAAKFAFDHLKARKAAILFDQKQAYSTGLRDNFRQAFTKMGGTITTEQAYTGGNPDFSAQLATIKESASDVVFIPGYYTDVGNIARQARQRADIQIPLLGGDGWESPKLGELGGESMNNCYYSNHYAPEDPRPESVAFVKAYKEAYNEDANALGALGYDSGKLLFDAMDRAASLSGADLAKAIAETKNFPGVTGSITINAQRNASKPMVIIEMKDGKPVYVTTINPPGAD